MNILTNIIVFIFIAIVGTPLKIFTKLIQLAQSEDYHFLGYVCFQGFLYSLFY